MRPYLIKGTGRVGETDLPRPIAAGGGFPYPYHRTQRVIERQTLAASRAREFARKGTRERE